MLLHCEEAKQISCKRLNSFVQSTYSYSLCRSASCCHQFHQLWGNAELTHGALSDVADGPYIVWFFFLLCFHSLAHTHIFIESLRMASTGGNLKDHPVPNPAVGWVPHTGSGCSIQSGLECLYIALLTWERWAKWGYFSSTRLQMAFLLFSYPQTQARSWYQEETKKRIYRISQCLAKSILVTREPRGENHEVDSSREQFLRCLGVLEGAHGSVQLHGVFSVTEVSASCTVLMTHIFWLGYETHLQSPVHFHKIHPAARDCLCLSDFNYFVRR